MRHWRLISVVILCCGLAVGYGLLGCGDDHDDVGCRDVFNKMSDCDQIPPTVSADD
jgi:hypothetical protein